MEECTLAGSPNWYLSQVLDCSWDNRVAYGSLMSLVILNPSRSTKPMIISHAHYGRVLSVSFPPKGFGNKLLSTSDTGEAFVWNLDTQKVSLSYKHPQKCGLFGSWSHANGDLIVLGDENGNILQWRLNLNTISLKAFREHSFAVVSCCPHDQNLVATGTKQGLVCVVNIKVPGKEFMLHKLRGHDSEVVSLAWCPDRRNIINLKNEADCFLLASSAKERKIFFWRAGQDGLYEAYVETPLAPRIQPAVKQWHCVSWYDSSQLIVSTVGGEVLILNASNFKSKKGATLVKWNTFSDTHNRCHVVVKCSPSVLEGASEKDSKLKETTTRWVWTYGADRVVAGICSDKSIPAVKINTIGGAVNAMSISPIDGTSLAIGAADKTIRVVNLSEPQLKTMQTFSQKVSGKVMSLSWHPSKDGWLAYGTSDGRIGVQFTCSIKQPLLFKPFSKESIYSMEWGPSLNVIKSSFQSTDSTEENEDGERDKVVASKYVLYAVGGGQIAAMDPKKPDQVFSEPFKTVLKAVLKPESLKSRNKPVSVTDLAWKPDYTLLALGDETGSIHLLHRTDTEDLALVANLKVHSSLIQDLSWHPQYCSDTAGVSLLANWLAAASNHTSIQILDATPVLEALKGSGADTSLPLSNIPCIATLKGHKLRVSKVSWSQHDTGRLLSVSYDQCAQVWDVINHEPVACYTLHCAPLYCCVWSPFNSSLAITAGQDGIIAIWAVQDQQTKLPVAKPRDASYLFDEAVEACLPIHGSENAGAHADGLSVKSQNKKREKAVLPLSGADLQKDASNIVILEHLLNSSVEGNIVQREGGDVDGSKSLPLHYAFFANQSAVEEYLSRESSNNVTRETGFTLNVWKGSPKDAILEAIATKSLDSFIVSMAPTVSHKMWVEASTAYVEQLKLAGEFTKASVYLLAIHKVEDAIKLLADNGKYRHAIAVARCRLPPDSPLIKSLLMDWAEENISQGKQSLAAACFASAGEWTKAAECLVLKKTCDRLLMAAQIMKKKSTELEVGTFYARECFDMALSLAEWDTAHKVLSLYPSLNHFALCLYIHQTIYNFKDSASVDEWLKFKHCDSEITSENEAVQTGTVCLSEKKVAALKKDLLKEITVNNESSALLALSCKVTLAYLAAPTLFPRVLQKFAVEDADSQTPDLQEAYRYLVQAMSFLYQYHITHKLTEDVIPLFLKLSIWLAPQGPNSGPFKVDSTASSPVLSLQSSLRAFLASGLLLWMIRVPLDSNTRSLLPPLIEALKCDIFSLESLKSFKVEFKLKVMQENKLNQISQRQNENQQEVIKVESDNSKEIKTSESEPQQLQEVLDQEGLESKNTNIVCSPDDSRKSPSTEAVLKECKSVEEDELEILTKWLRDFKEKREKVPNPYLSYSHLLQYLKSLKTDEHTELIEKYQTFWEESTSSIDC